MKTYENLEINEIHCFGLSVKNWNIWRIVFCVSHPWISSVGSPSVWGSSNWVSLTSQTSVAFTWHSLATSSNQFRWLYWNTMTHHFYTKLKSSLWNSIKPTPHHAVPFRFQTLSFLPCSVLLSEARLWKKASILASLIQGVGQRSIEVSRKDFSSLIKLNSKQFN